MKLLVALPFAALLACYSLESHAQSDSSSGIKFKADISTIISDTDSTNTLITDANPASAYASGGKGTNTIPTAGKLEVATNTRQPANIGHGTINADLSATDLETYTLVGVAGSEIANSDNPVPSPSLPKISIVAPAYDVLVYAEENAVFTLTSSNVPPANSMITVNYKVESPADFIDTSVHSNPMQTVPLSTSSLETLLTIMTRSPRAFYGKSTIKVTLLAGKDYTLADPVDQIAVANVVNPPDISDGAAITTGGPIEEGQDAVFTIWGNANDKAKVFVSQDGDRIFQPVPARLTIPSIGRYVLTIPTIDDNLDQFDSNITLTIEVQLASRSSAGGQDANKPLPVVEKTATIEVMDNDDVNGNVSRLYTVVAEVIEAILSDSLVTSPVTRDDVSITADSPIAEGQDAVFTILASGKSYVRIYVSQTSDHIFQPIPKDLFMPSSGKYTLTIPTKDNIVDDDDSSITVTIYGQVAVRDQPTPKVTPNLTDPDPTPKVQVVKRTATIKIMDNDDADGDEGDLYSVAPNVIESILLSIPFTPESSSDGGRSQIGGGVGSPFFGRNEETSLLESASVATPPTISIAADSNRIEEGSAAMFTLTASHAVQSDITVNIELTETGDFLIGSAAISVGMNSKSTSVQFAVKTAADNLAESDGAIQARIRQGKDYVVDGKDRVTVQVSDANDRLARQNRLAGANRRIMPQLAGLIGSNSLNTVTHRVGQAFAAGGDMSVELGGNSTLAQVLHEGIESMDRGLQPWQQVLGNSSFAAGLFPEEGEINRATVWGLGDYRSLYDGEVVAGDVFTGHLGFDSAIGDGMIAGLSTSITRSEADNMIGGDQLTYQTSSTGLHPYVGLEFSEGDRLQFTAGYGLGQIELDQTGYQTEFLDSSFFNFGLGGEMILYSNESILNGGTSELSIDGESWLASQFVKSRNDATSNMRADGRHLRLSLLGTHEQQLASGATVTPEVSLSLREEGMNRQSFLGFEMAGGLGYGSIHGYRITSNGEVLLSGVNQVQEWGMSGHLTYDANSDQLGLLVDLTNAWGQSAAAKDSTLWNHRIIDREFSADLRSNESATAAVIGYGIAVWDGKGVLTPFGGISLTQNNEDEIQLGGKLRIGSEIELELTGERTLQENRLTEDEINLETSVKW